MEDNKHIVPHESVWKHKDTGEEIIVIDSHRVAHGNLDVTSDSISAIVTKDGINRFVMDSLELQEEYENITESLIPFDFHHELHVRSPGSLEDFTSVADSLVNNCMNMTAIRLTPIRCYATAEEFSSTNIAPRIELAQAIGYWNRGLVRVDASMKPEDVDPIKLTGEELKIIVTLLGTVYLSRVGYTKEDLNNVDPNDVIREVIARMESKIFYVPHDDTERHQLTGQSYSFDIYMHPRMVTDVSESTDELTEIDIGGTASGDE